jgi:hypothetical protein
MCANSGHFLKKCAKAKTKLVLKHFNYIGHSLVFFHLISPGTSVGIQTHHLNIKSQLFYHCAKGHNQFLT